MTGPLVSVVIPCYNAKAFVAETLECVLAQTWKNVEIIVVDDGSTDGSIEEVARFVPRGVVHIIQPNAGASAARNRGFRESRGEFIQFLDADDLISPKKIEAQVGRLIGNLDCIASAPWARLYTTPDGTRFEAEPVWRDLDARDWFALSRHNGFGMQFPAMWLLPRGIVQAGGPWHEELSLADDTEYFTRVILTARRVLFCEAARCYYRSNVPGSLSGLKSERAWRSFFRANEFNERTVLTVEDSPRMRRVLSICWQRFAHAAYVYQAELAETALVRAAQICNVEIRPSGGRQYRLAAAVFGWRTALEMQAQRKSLVMGFGSVVLRKATRNFDRARNLRILARPRELAAALHFMRNQKVLSTRDHLDLTADALLNASRHSPDGGYAMAYSLYLGWAPGYVETTGYIVPTALDIAATIGRQDLRQNALAQGEWLLSHQYEDGSFPDASRGKPEIFDTGQVLLGLMRLNAETGEARYHEAGLRAARWLAQQLSAARDAEVRPVPSYDTRSAAAIIDFGRRAGDDSLVDIGSSFLDEVLGRKLPSGLFQHSQLGGDRGYLLHTIVYVLEGYLHAHAVLGEERWLAAAKAGAEPLKRICREREIVPYSFYDEQWTPTTRERCITGLAQWAGVCLRLFELTGEEAYRDCASNALYYVKSKQIQWPGQLRGALPGSVPLWGHYLRMSFPNWNLKFFGDALLKWSRLGLDDALHQETFVRCAHAIGADRIGWTDTANSISEFDVEILKRIERLLAPLEAKGGQGLEVLDLGCGEGRYLRWLAAAHPDWKVTGIDPIAPSCNDLAIDVGSAVSIPRGDASTDAVYSCIALQHVHDVELVMREVARVLKPGGIFIVFDRNPRSLRGVLKPWHELKGRWLYEWDAPFRERWHTRAAWSRMLKRAGFNLVARQSLTHFNGNGLRGLMPINRFLLVAGQKRA